MIMLLEHSWPTRHLDTVATLIVCGKHCRPTATSPAPALARRSPGFRVSFSLHPIRRRFIKKEGVIRFLAVLP